MNKLSIASNSLPFFNYRRYRVMFPNFQFVHWDLCDMVSGKLIVVRWGLISLGIPIMQIRRCHESLYVDYFLSSIRPQFPEFRIHASVNYEDKRIILHVTSYPLKSWSIIYAHWFSNECCLAKWPSVPSMVSVISTHVKIEMILEECAKDPDVHVSLGFPNGIIIKFIMTNNYLALN